MSRPHKAAGLSLLCLAALVPPLIGGPAAAVGALAAAMWGAVLLRGLRLS